jgi:hypothetical protein
MLRKIISGGQTGADQGGWRAAQAFGVQTGGWMPLGFVTETDSCPQFAEQFGATELQAGDLTHTEANVHDSDASLWFGDTTTARAHATVDLCVRSGKPCMPLYPGASFDPSHVATWIAKHEIKTLNVAGSRESEEPGIGDRVERFLCDVLQHLGHQRA